jgi:hypothetical protein
MSYVLDEGLFVLFSSNMHTCSKMIIHPRDKNNRLICPNLVMVCVCIYIYIVYISKTLGFQ